jgi:hypothetical protein
MMSMETLLGGICIAWLLATMAGWISIVAMAVLT